MEFLDNRKEADELYMVVDEELKMMARICEDGGRVLGPYLKEMAHLAHTEYFIEGQTSRDVREVLRETLFAPTVTGSPVALQRFAGEGVYHDISVHGLSWLRAAARPARDAAGRR
ncbi:phenazine biosynthesis protein PhzE [Pseudomonas aeruginosa PA38182]|nr:phenazine biosynthesis protein PhzE [Pseudomonas aeruginosa PA38182]